MGYTNFPTSYSVKSTPVSADLFLLADSQNSNNTVVATVGSMITAIGGMSSSVYDPANIAQQVVGTTATQTLTNKTLTSPHIATILNTGTLTLPTATTTLVGTNTTDSLSNKTITSSTYNGVTLSTGSGTSAFLRGDGTYATPSGGGNVTGPGSSLNNNIVTFNGTSGTLISDSGVNISAIVSGVITGEIRLWTTASAPTGWLIANGAAVSRSTYSALFSVISTTYGVGDGSTTFNLPNLAGNVPVGYKSGDANFGTLAGTGGEATHTLTTTEIPSHSHFVIDNSNSSGGSNTAFNITTSTTGRDNTTHTDSTGGGGAHNNIQPYLTINYIIKT